MVGPAKKVISNTRGGIGKSKAAKTKGDEILDVVTNKSNIKSIDPENVDFGDSYSMKSTDYDNDDDFDNDMLEGKRIKGDMPSTFTTGKYSGQKSSRKSEFIQNDDEDDEEQDQDDDSGDELDSKYDFEDRVGDMDDEDEDEDDDIVGSSNTDKADALLKKLQQQEVDEPILVSKESEKSEMEKSINTKNQSDLYDDFLTTRIQLQKLLVTSNRFPKPKNFNLFIEADQSEGGNSISKKFKEAKRESASLLADLYDLQYSLMNQNDEIPKDDDIKNNNSKRIRDVSSSLNDIWSILEEQNQKLMVFHNSTIDKWNNRIGLTVATGNNKNLKSINQSILSQINNTLSDFERLQKRTKLKRVTYKIFGENDQQQTTQQQQEDIIDQDEYDDEIFDDSDFYQVLLDSIESDEVGSQYWTEMRNLKKKKKKKVNQKASKGRILRFEIFPKLENFMTPQPLPPSNWNIDQLYSNLFGGLGAIKNDE
ncbi:hypothetical protein CYY_000031 [Polysphondylium violaceum]|uniref:TRAUB family protein n=1 Tax=Polysphondylium violaceum TaxID=133409 RepID=A0A8J4V2R6_9MYCE|nr:hypothetical protein CYY_000031 [Polysphondylium violaceum]